MAELVPKKPEKSQWGFEGLMEQLILEVIIKQVEEKKVIRSSQHGFTKGK